MKYIGLTLNRSRIAARFFMLALYLVLSVGSLAFAAAAPAGGGGAAATPAAGDPFTNVQLVVCGLANAITGPVGIAIGFLVLVAGLIAMQVANRDAIPMITRAVAGTALLIGAGAAFTAIVVNSGC
jgi:type IV secretion system protein TrbC